MTITLTADSATVTLADPSMVSPVMIRQIHTYNLVRGGVKVFNKEISSDSITIEGVQTTSADSKANDIHTISDNGETIALSGMYDSNLDGNYKILNNLFVRQSAETGIYHYTITLEKVN